MPKITLDAEAFKVLASDTRLQILKSLDERPKTVSELSRELTLNKATVHEHLQQLLSGELIKKNEREGRKWVYYTLSWKGKSLLHPENTTVLVLLGLASLGSAGAVVQLGNWLRWWGANKVFTDDSPGAADEETLEAAEAPQEQGSDTAGSSPSDGRQDDEVQRFDAGDGDDSAGAEGDATSDTGGFFDFLQDSEFWLFAVLALLATATLLAAGLVKQRARGHTLGSLDAPPAQVGAVKSPGHVAPDADDEDPDGDDGPDAADAPTTPPDEELQA